MSIIQHIDSLTEKPFIAAAPVVPAAGVSLLNVLTHVQVIVGIIGGTLTIAYTVILIWASIKKIRKGNAQR